MEVTVEVSSLPDLRDIAGLTNEGIAEQLMLSRTYLSEKMMKRRYWYPDELSELVMILAAAPRKIKIDVTALIELAGDSFRKRRYIRRRGLEAAAS